jgi:flavin reductase
LINSEQDLNEGFRIGMRCLASGVSVLSVTSSAGERAAMTVSSVTSVSDNPPSLLVCVNKATRMNSIMKNGEYFCINILSEKQQSISEICASPDMAEERFKTGSWVQDQKSGSFFLEDAPAVFVCKTAKQIDHGTHVIYVGDIAVIRAAPELGKPLIYAHGAYLRNS